MKDPLLTYLEREFERGWKEFAKTIEAENRIKNERVYRALTAVKGAAWVYDFKKLMQIIAKWECRLEIVNRPVGVELRESRVRDISEIWINQRNLDGEVRGTVCVRVKPERWVLFHFSHS